MCASGEECGGEDRSCELLEGRGWEGRGGEGTEGRGGRETRNVCVSETTSYVPYHENV